MTAIFETLGYVAHALAAVVLGVVAWVVVAGAAMWLIARRLPAPPRDDREGDGR